MKEGVMVHRVCFFLVAIFLPASGSPVSDECNEKIELSIILDTSSSYGEGEQWNKVGQFVKEFLDFYNISPNGTHIGIVTYSRVAKVLFRHLDSEYQNRDGAMDAILAALNDTQQSGHPWTEKALVKAHDVLFTEKTSRNWQVLFVFTGGKTPNPGLYDEIVGSIEAKGVNIVVVSWDQEEAAKIAGKRGHAIYVKDISDALQKLPEIVGKTCLVHGGYTEWTSWGSCSQTCGGGQQNRQRSCSNPVPSANAKNCHDLGPSQDARACNSQPCGDIDGGYSEWTEWSVCSHTCGGGSAVRHRLCVNPPQQENGQFCDVIGPDVQTKQCNTGNCRDANKQPCQQGLNLAILLDQSLSISKKSFELVLRTFLPDFIETLKISKSKTHVALVRFYEFSHIDFNFAERKFFSKQVLKKYFLDFSVNTILKTRIDRGLLTVLTEVFTPRAGERSSKQNVLLVLTDGRPFPPKNVLPFNATIPSLREEKKVHIVAVGYGRDKIIRPEILEEIGGDNVLIMKRRGTGDSGYKSYVPQVKEMVCTVDGGYTQWSMWSTCSVSCGAGTQFRSRSCTAPPPRVKGADCTGDFSEVRACGDVYCPVAPAKCKNLALDLAVVLETSTELGEEHFRHGRDFLKQVLNLIDISQNETHVSLVLFNKHVDIIVALDQSIYHSNEAVNRVFRVLPALFESGKRLDLALKYLHSSVFTKTRGDRSDVKNVAVIVTDGVVDKGHRDGLNNAISSLKNNEVKLITVSANRVNIREEVLYEIAGSDMTLCTSYQDLTRSVEKVAAMVCDV
ncbi:uncharacterized protein [Montipora foliosa]|uniref:uncharacterized protein n=1 Tax=Montipora foliosa TaxID=591990 RepID=UPI0035F1BE9D